MNDSEEVDTFRMCKNVISAGKKKLRITKVMMFIFFLAVFFTTQTGCLSLQYYTASPEKRNSKKEIEKMAFMGFLGDSGTGAGIAFLAGGGYGYFLYPLAIMTVDLAVDWYFSEEGRNHFVWTDEKPPEAICEWNSEDFFQYYEIDDRNESLRSIASFLSQDVESGKANPRAP